MSRFKVIPIVAGVCLAAATLIGANRLSNGSGTPGGAGGNPAPPAKVVEGLVAKGTVAAETEPMAFFLPAHLQAGKVAKVHVKEGQTVKPGDALVKFDDWQLQGELKKAEAMVQAAIRAHTTALGKQAQHAVLVDKAKLAITNATQQRDKAKEVLEAVRKNFQIQFSVTKTEGSTPRTVRDEPDFLRAEALVETAENQIKEKTLDLAMLEKEAVTAAVDAAVFQSQAAQAEVERIKDAMTHSELKAETGGVIERLNVAAGQVMYPQSRVPMFWLIPDGTRYVKAEIVPEFGYKIRDKDGAKVVISDDSAPGLTYEGTVEQIGTAFLPKTGGVDLLNGKPTNVLEVRVRVTDPAPAGKPPLRVGQPVRVTFP
jgi:multidrug resistance efflux pump